jgi:hypothetical protein
VRVTRATTVDGVSDMTQHWTVAVTWSIRAPQCARIACRIPQKRGGYSLRCYVAVRPLSGAEGRDSERDGRNCARFSVDVAQSLSWNGTRGCRPILRLPLRLVTRGAKEALHQYRLGADNSAARCQRRGAS